MPLFEYLPGLNIPYSETLNTKHAILYLPDPNYYSTPQTHNVSFDSVSRLYDIAPYRFQRRGELELIKQFYFLDKKLHFENAYINDLFIAQSWSRGNSWASVGLHTVFFMGTSYLYRYIKYCFVMQSRFASIPSARMRWTIARRRAHRRAIRFYWRGLYYGIVVSFATVFGRRAFEEKWIIPAICCYCATELALKIRKSRGKFLYPAVGLVYYGGYTFYRFLVENEWERNRLIKKQDEYVRNNMQQYHVEFLLDEEEARRDKKPIY